MKVIIAGGRDYSEYITLIGAIQNSGFNITTVISGGASGVDAMGERYARENNIECEVYYAKWKEHGPKAGPMRNAVMAECADALIALWDGKSKGTKNMIEIATKKGLQVYVLHYNTSQCIDDYFEEEE